MDGSRMYVFSSRPRVVEDPWKPRWSPSGRMQLKHGNIMRDPRVFRGNVSSQPLKFARAPLDSADMRTQEERTSGAVGPKRVRRKFRPRTPEPVQGRKHLEIQTESYLEELSDIPVVKEIECQTDAFLDRPETPIFIPAKTGKDAETQIDEGDLFDFEEEVRPILEILVGKTLEQSLLEVMEEEELAALMAQQRAFLERRNNQLPEVHRLQEQERRRREERERRMAEQKRALQEEKEVVEKIAARALTQQQLADLVPSVLASLRREGYFYDPVERDVETHFFPRLMEDVQRVLQKNCRARELLDEIIYEVTQRRLEGFEVLETSDP
ncbi:radial spoke head protein 3 homolog B [Oryzias melastigma]|uniref:Radial spoke head 3 n=1 Tax=Oryzias melastigma TaxID=30732 RepID=A0A3B3BC44_ORYME|nr:radial spoke head protein 3 homolog B [Oryzias melastigma]